MPNPEGGFSSRLTITCPTAHVIAPAAVSKIAGSCSLKLGCPAIKTIPEKEISIQKIR